jgi:hypothetical protein
LGFRRIASLVLLALALVIGAKLFTSVQNGPVPVEIHYLLGDPPRAKEIEVLIQPEGGGPAVARFETSLISSDVKQITRLPGGRHDMDITMTGQSGARRTVRRTIDAVRDVVIRIDLSRDLP